MSASRKPEAQELPFVVFTDGASSGNPGPGGWGTIIVSPQGLVTELGGGERLTTNNRMEMMGTVAALDHLRDQPGEIALYTDSTYVIRGITQWVWGWRKRDWKTAEGGEVANAELWKRLFGLVAKRGKENPVHWKYVRGHSGVPGNERVDEIAVGFSKGQRPSLYRGPLLKYDIPVMDLPEDVPIPEMRPKGAVKAAALSYLSVVNGVPQRHASWKECEARVKGRPGAKFKKAMTAKDEEAILAEWGFGLKDIK